MKYLFYILFVGVLFSCEDKIDIDHPDGGERVVVEALLTGDSIIQKIQLTSSISNKGEAIYDPIIDADVKVYVSDGVVQEFIYDSGVYLSKSKFKVEVGKEYTCQIIKAGGDTIISAPELVTPSSVIDSIYYLHVDDYEFVNGPPRGVDEEDVGYHVFMDMQELPGYGNAYYWKVYVDGVLLTRPEELFIENDLSIYSFFYNEDGAYQEQLDFNFLAPNNSIVKFEMYSISQSFYNYMITLFNNSVEAGSPFSNPPISPIGNLSYKDEENKEQVFGYFGAGVFDSKSIEIKGDKE